GNRLAVHVENDVAGLEAVAGGAVGIDLRHHDAFAAVTGRRQRQTEPGHLATGRLAFLAPGTLRPLPGQLAERHGDSVPTPVTGDAELDGRPRRHGADTPRKVAGVGHRL